MATIPVYVKHQGKRHQVDLDLSSTGEVFKYQLYSLTGVEPSRQKILVKGGQLKDDTDLSTLNVKPNHVFMMMGTPTPSGDNDGLGRPKEKMKFVEDMTEAEAARVEGATPAGLQNLGNTCYLNSTLQVLRSIPELQEGLGAYKPESGSSDALSAALGVPIDFTASLRDLYQQMSETQEGFPPLVFLQALTTTFPQFAQKSRTGHGYAQQDAEEAWTQIISQLRQKLKIKGLSASSSSSSVPTQSNADVSFIDKYLAGRFESVLECDEPAAQEGGEEPVRSEDIFLKLNCHIGRDTNHLRDGLLAGLEEKIEKNSPVLGRDAVYTKKSRISRLPKYLTVHFVRFFWKREVQKKAKIMRKITFQHELDVVEFCTEDLKKILIPVRDKIRDVRKEEQDVERAWKRQKRMLKDQEEKEKEIARMGPEGGSKKPVEKHGEKVDQTQDADKAPTSVDTEMPDIVHKTDAEIDADRAASILAAKRELLALVNPELAKDDGSNKSGLYELRGVITHQGASADSGHYTSYVKKSGLLDAKTGKLGGEDGKWWWFNDDRVTEVENEKIDSLSGGGESHSALILLYRAIPLPTLEEPKK